MVLPIKGQVVFSRYEDVEASSSCLENGAFLSIGHAGYNSEDVIKEVSDTVDMVVRVNFKRLMTIFNVIIVCPVSTCNLVVEAMTTSGAAKTQQGFIVNLGRKRETRTKDLLMTEVKSTHLLWGIGQWQEKWWTDMCPNTHQMWLQWRVKKQTNSQKKFMSTLYQRFLRKGISSLTLAVEMETDCWVD
ncbi:uncharacterized protein [Montipora capricornis]|uniref:uncharacterized protein isoform X1 n=1 Tax=Montipora capricornis TaxID=246305 RepID=UPI0035F1B421